MGKGEGVVGIRGMEWVLDFKLNWDDASLGEGKGRSWERGRGRGDGGRGGDGVGGGEVGRGAERRTVQ